MDDKQFINQCDAALCIWEYMLGEWRDHTPIETINPPKMILVWMDCGTVQMRRAAITLSKWANDIWDILQKTKDDNVEWDVSFDWEFIPRIMGLVYWGMDKDKKVILTYPTVEGAVDSYNKEYQRGIK